VDLALKGLQLSEGVVNVKILYNVYMKNLRFLPYDPETAIENLKKVLLLSDWLCGPQIKYKHSQINFEVGKALSASLARRKEGRQWIEQGRVVIEDTLGSEHPFMQKYFAFISLQESIEDRAEALKALKEQSLTFIRDVNRSSSGKESLFVLEAYFDTASILSETESGNPDKLKACLAKMEAICSENHVQSHYVTQTKMLLAMDIFSQNCKSLADETFDFPLQKKQQMCAEPIQILEKALIDTLRQLSVEGLPETVPWQFLRREVPLDVLLHPFVDSIMHQIA